MYNSVSAAFDMKSNKLNQLVIPMIKFPTVSLTTASTLVVAQKILSHDFMQAVKRIGRDHVEENQNQVGKGWISK